MTPNNNEDDNRDNNTNNIDKSATSTTDDTTTTTNMTTTTTTITSEANETSTATVMTETITSPHTFQSSSTTTPSSSSTSPSTFSPCNNDDNENDHLVPHMNNNNINSNDNNHNEGGDDDDVNEHNNQQQKLLHSDMTDDSSSITITNNNNNNNSSNINTNNNNNKSSISSSGSSSNHRNSSQGGVMTDGCSTDHHTNNHTMTLNTYSNQTTTTRTRTSTATSVMDSGDQRTTTTTPVFSNDETSAHLDLTLTADTEDPLQPIASSSSSDDALKKKQKKSFLTGKKVLLGKVPTSHARKQQQKKRKNGDHGGSGGDHHRQRIDSVSPSSPPMVRLNTSARHSTSMSVRSMCAKSDENHESFDNTFTGSSALNTARGENFLRQNTLAPNASTGKGEPCMEYDGNHDDHHHHDHHDDHHHHDHAQCSHQDKNLLLQLWPSKTTLLFGGRVMLGADKGRLSFTALLIVGVFLLFVTFITSYFYLIHLAAGIIMTVFPIGAVVYVLGTLYITATMDPGIVPRKSIVQNNLRDEPDLEELEEKFPQETTCVFVGGKPVFLRYCYTCKLYRPPRSSHCSQCDNCVERFDHHCPWTGTCIGKRNYRPFMHFVGSATISLVFAVLICMFQIAWSCYELGTTQPFKITGSIVWQIIATIFSAGIILISIALLAFVGTLFCFHLYLISSGKTTSEHIKSKKGPQASFSQGFWGNWISGFLCAPCEPSKLPFRRPLSLYHAIMLQPEEDDVSLDKA